MTPLQIREHCNQQIAAIPGMEDTAEIGLRMRGSWGKRGTKRMWPGGPKGNIVAETAPGEVMVFFNAREVLAALDNAERTPPRDAAKEGSRE